MFDNCLTDSYAVIMAKDKRITTRELLRNFKNLKEQLLNGAMHYLVIDVGNNQELEISLRRGSNTGIHLAKAIRNQEPPIVVKTTDLFEELLSSD